jgi:NDP-sugar pyrophosphorylase family protein
MYPVALLAGGLGKRIRSSTGDSLPKALLPVAGRPFIDYKLAGLASQGIEHVVLLLGHGAEKIIEHIDAGKDFGLRISVVHDGPALRGTGGAVAGALTHLGEVFWVTYGDTYLRVDVAGAEKAFSSERKEGLMTVIRNRDQWDKSNVDVRDGIVVSYEKDSRPEAHEYIDYGMMILRADVFRAAQLKSRTFDLADVLREAVSKQQMMAFEVQDRFYEVGTPAGLADSEAFFRSGETQKLFASYG